MDNSQIAKVLEDRHKYGLKGVLQIHNWRKIRKSLSFISAIVVSLIGVTLSRISQLPSVTVLSDFLQTALSILPNLLGFSLGGYALIVGFGNTALIKSMTTSLSDEKGSLFQKLSAIFAFSIVLQAIALIFVIAINFIYKLQFSFISDIDLKYFFYPAINLLAMFVVMFLFLWSLFLLPFVVTNIFSFGQSHHLLLTVERFKDDPKSFLEEIKKIMEADKKN